MGERSSESPKESLLAKRVEKMIEKVKISMIVEEEMKEPLMKGDRTSSYLPNTPLLELEKGGPSTPPLPTGYFPRTSQE
jgi:hypothetical protein